MIALLAMQAGFVPAGLNTTAIDPSLRSDYRIANSERCIERVLSNSFGFGGVNCSLVFQRG